MKFWAILKDSFTETRDFKLFYVLMGLAIVLAGFCASFSFPERSLIETVSTNLGDQAGPTMPAPGSRDASHLRAAAVDVSEFQANEVSTEDSGPVQRCSFLMTPRSKENLGKALDMAVREKELMRLVQEGEVRITQIFRQIMPGTAPKSRKAWISAVENYLNSLDGFSDAKVLEIDIEDNAPPGLIKVQVNLDEEQLLHHHRMGILFGLWEVDIPKKGVALFAIQSVMVSNIAGWVGLVVAVVVTAGFIPNMLQKGAIDLLLVKPIHRPMLLISKYLGGLLFVLIIGIVLVGGTWIALAYRSGNWSPWYLASTLVLTFFFAILYSVSTLIGVLTRSSMTAILVTLTFWFMLFLLNLFHGFIHMPEEARFEWIAAMPEWLTSIINGVHYVLPKPGTLSQLNQELLLKVNESAGFGVEGNAFESPISWTETLISSSAFIVVMLGLASWRFSRKDY